MSGTSRANRAHRRVQIDAREGPREIGDGVAVSLDSTLSGGGYTLIFDPRDRQLLSFEQTLIGPPHKLHLQRGAVMAYTTILASWHVARIGATR